jgi:hypothetical protein
MAIGTPGGCNKRARPFPRNSKARSGKHAPRTASNCLFERVLGPRLCVLPPTGETDAHNSDSCPHESKNGYPEAGLETALAHGVDEGLLITTAGRGEW